MKLSVLITTYNQERYIDETIASVLEQKVDFKYEILLGDDGSSDGSFEKLHSWRARYPDKIRVFQQHRDRAVVYDPIARASANRIALAKEARGEFITFLDGDDIYVSPQKLQKQIDILQNPLHAGCIGCGHRIDRWWKEENRTEPMNNPYMPEQVFVAERYWAVMYFHICTLVFRNIFRGAFPENVFSDNPFDDENITCYFAKFGNIYYLPHLVVYYRQHEAGIFTARNELEQYIIRLSANAFEKKLHPDWKAAIAHRHRYGYRYLFRHRRILDGPKYDAYRRDETYNKTPLLHRILHYYRHGYVNRLLVLAGLVYNAVLSYWLRIRKGDYFRRRPPDVMPDSKEALI